MIFLTPHTLFLRSLETGKSEAGLGDQAAVHPPPSLPFCVDLTRYDQERNFAPGTSPAVCILDLLGKDLDTEARVVLALAPGLCLASDSWGKSVASSGPLLLPDKYRGWSWTSLKAIPRLKLQGLMTVSFKSIG